MRFTRPDGVSRGLRGASRDSGELREVPGVIGTSHGVSEAFQVVTVNFKGDPMSFIGAFREPRCVSGGPVAFEEVPRGLRRYLEFSGAFPRDTGGYLVHLWGSQGRSRGCRVCF